MDTRVLRQLDRRRVHIHQISANERARSPGKARARSAHRLLDKLVNLAPTLDAEKLFALMHGRGFPSRGWGRRPPAAN